MILTERAEQHLGGAETRLVHIVGGIGGDHLSVGPRSVRALHHAPLRRRPLQTRLRLLHRVRRRLIADFIEIARNWAQMLIARIGTLSSLYK